MNEINVRDITVRTKLLIRFLKEHNCYKQYMFNLHKAKKHWDDDYDNYDDYDYVWNEHNCIKDVMHRIEINGFYGSEIDYGFKWGTTEQGHLFWSDINKRWRELMYECNKKKKIIY